MNLDTTALYQRLPNGRYKLAGHLSRCDSWALGHHLVSANGNGCTSTMLHIDPERARVLAALTEAREVMIRELTAGLQSRVNQKWNGPCTPAQAKAIEDAVYAAFGHRNATMHGESARDAVDAAIDALQRIVDHA